MKHKIIPVIASGFSTRFFSIPIEEDDWSEKPHLRISTMNAAFALLMGDDGLNSIGIHQGDYLLFRITNPLSNEQLALVRNSEEEYMIQEINWTNETDQLRILTSNKLNMVNGVNQVNIHTDHIRVVALLDHVIKPEDELNIVYFK